MLKKQDLQALLHPVTHPATWTPYEQQTIGLPHNNFNSCLHRLTQLSVINKFKINNFALPIEADCHHFYDFKSFQSF